MFQLIYCYKIADWHMVSAMVFHIFFCLIIISFYYHVTGCCTCSPGFAPACRPMTADQARVWPYFGQVETAQVRQTHMGRIIRQQKKELNSSKDVLFSANLGIWYVSFIIYLVKSWTTCFYSLVMSYVVFPWRYPRHGGCCIDLRVAIAGWWFDQLHGCWKMSGIGKRCAEIDLWIH